MKLRPDLAAGALAALVAVCLTACALAGVDAPPFLAELGIAALGGALGAALPRGSAPPPQDFRSEQLLEHAETGRSSAPAAAAAPAPRPAYDPEPATGIFARIQP